MGLASFWSSITGPKVKEISPMPCQTAWLERGRPTTSSGSRIARSYPEFDSRPTTSSGDKKFGRHGRGRSWSRPRRTTASEPKVAEEKKLSAKSDRAEVVPDVPTLPPSFSRDSGTISSLPSPGESAKPDTNISTEGLEELHIFELPGETLPAEDVKSNPLIRQRSESSTRESKLPAANPSLFDPKGSGKNKTLPPPPPPTGPLPPLPTAKTASQLPIFANSSNPRHANPQTIHERRKGSGSSGASATPQLARSSSDSESILEAFPSVPGLVRDHEETPESSVTNSDVDEVNSYPTIPRGRAMTASRDKRLPDPIKTSNAQQHKHKDSAIGTPKTPITPSDQIQKGLKRYPEVRSVDEDEPLASFLSQRELRDWSRAAQFVENVYQKDQSGALVSPNNLDNDTDRMRMINPSNQNALAQLEFGALK